MVIILDIVLTPSLSSAMLLYHSVSVKPWTLALVLITHNCVPYPSSRSLSCIHTTFSTCTKLIDRSFLQFIFHAAHFVDMNHRKHHAAALSSARLAILVYNTSIQLSRPYLSHSLYCNLLHKTLLLYCTYVQH
jgi:hypothetical protein